MRITVPHQCSVSLVYYLVLSILIFVPISAWPTTTFYHNHYGRQQLASGSSTVAPPIPSDTQTIETSQVFTV